MDPFGNFGWNFGFGFGWILIGVFALLMIAAIVHLISVSYKGRLSESEKKAELNSLKEDICENKISIDELEEKIEHLAA